MIGSTTSAQIAGKSIATAGVGAGLVTITPWAWAFALCGATLALYFEPEHKPKQLWMVLFGIIASGFGAALLAASVPHAPMLGWTGNIDLSVRAGLCGLAFRFLWEQGKKWFGKRADKDP